jgi:hypothetical protein
MLDAVPLVSQSGKAWKATVNGFNGLYRHGDTIIIAEFKGGTAKLTKNYDYVDWYAAYKKLDPSNQFDPSILPALGDKVKATTKFKTDQMSDDWIRIVAARMALNGDAVQREVGLEVLKKLANEPDKVRMVVVSAPIENGILQSVLMGIRKFNDKFTIKF